MGVMAQDTSSLAKKKAEEEYELIRRFAALFHLLADGKDTITKASLASSAMQPEVRAHSANLGFESMGLWKMLFAETQVEKLHIQEFVSKCLENRGHAQS